MGPNCRELGSTPTGWLKTLGFSNPGYTWVKRVDHFESIIGTLLEIEHYWIRRSFKVTVSKSERREIKKHSMPRTEIDLLAFDFAQNEVLAIEAKSFLDSQGVMLAALQLTHDVPEGKYKLFTCQRYRTMVLKQLLQDLINNGMANSSTTIRLGLVAGKVYRGQSELVRDFMAQNGWFFWSPEDVKKRVKALADQGYENDPAIITAKILRD